MSKVFESEAGSTFGNYMPIKKYIFELGGVISNKDVLLDHAACFSEPMNSKPVLLQEHGTRDGFAPMGSVAVFTGTIFVCLVCISLG